MLVEIEKVIVNDRIRKDFGDIEGLANSIKTKGLINPPVVTPEFELIAGERRYKALKQLGYNQIEVRVMSVEDEEHMLNLEIDENEERKEFSKLERLDWARRLERIESIKAEKRRGTRTDLCENFLTGYKGRTTDIVANKLGIGSGRQYEKEKYIEDNLYLVAEEEKQSWDKGDISDHAMFKKIKSEKDMLEGKTKRLEDEKFKLEQEKNNLMSELQKEKSKQAETKVVEKIVEKVVDNTDYSLEAKLKKLEEDNNRLAESKRVYEDAMNTYKKNSDEYQEFKDKMFKMSCVKGGSVDEVKALDDMDKLYISINKFIKTELSPVQYEYCLNFIDKNEHIAGSFVNMINIVEDWCLDMRAKLNQNNNIITVEVN